MPAWLNLLAISFLTLYFELLIVRWLPTEIRILAYFSNVTLITAVLGMGVGTLVWTRSRFRPEHAYWLFAALIAVAYLYGGLDIALPLATTSNFVWNGLSRAATGTPSQYLALFFFLALNTAAFVPLGQMLGRAFDQLPPIRAYSVNVTGAILGIGAFALFSVIGLPPTVWFLVGFALLWPLLPRTRAVWAGGVVCVGLVLAGSFHAGTRWSPYYKIDVAGISTAGTPVGFELHVNQDSHQQALDLSGRFDRLGDLATRRRIYDEPYRVGTNGDVLIVGAGTGNDVAAALRAGARSVEAVELDPVILDFGALHPEKPYQDPRVVAVNADARGYLRRSGKQYDKIVLGYLDSHALFSAMSSVRLDNFVYTEQFFRELKDHLRPNGVLAVTFTVHEAWIANRLYALFRNTFGEPPLVFQGARSSSCGTVFLGGAPVAELSPEYVAFDPAAGHNGRSWIYGTDGGYLAPTVFSDGIDLPSDDWPYLYLSERAIPLNYLIPMLVLTALGMIFVGGQVGGVRAIDFHFFFLGAAFLLVETKALTELAVFLGSTWTVNAFVIAMILALILLANLVASRWAVPTGPTYVALLVWILATYAVGVDWLIGWDSPARTWVVVAVLCMPLFFAGLIFARHIAERGQAWVALGSNMLGAVVGGVLEYSSMLWGLRALYLVAAGLYLLSWTAQRFRVAPALVAGPHRRQ